MSLKYITEIIIEKPREKVIELYDNLENLKEWQPGLKSFENISGEPGKEGSKSKLLFENKGKDIEMIETIIKRNLPEEFSAIYDAKGVHNIQVNRFEDINGKQTKWISESEFQFSGFMKLIGIIGKSAFKKQTQKYMEYFKEFAEK